MPVQFQDEETKNIVDQIRNAEVKNKVVKL